MQRPPPRPPPLSIVDYQDEGLQVTIGSGVAVDPELWGLVRRTVERVFGRPDSVLPAHGEYIVMEHLIWVRR